jgi:uncharacterized membrane protein
MRLPFPLLLRARRGLLVYQLVLILLVIIILIVVLFFVARRHQPGVTSPAADTSAAAGMTYVPGRALAPDLLAT